jgi:hypothetical protein
MVVPCQVSIRVPWVRSASANAGGMGIAGLQIKHALAIGTPKREIRTIPGRYTCQ